MAVAIRKDRSSLLWAYESTYGVFPTTNTWSHLGYLDNAILPDPEYKWTSQYGFPQSRRTNIMRGKTSYRGSISDIKLQTPTLIQTLLFPANVNNNVNDTSPFNSFSIASYIYDTNGSIPLARVWTGGRVSRASIHAKEGEELRLSLDDIAFNRLYVNRSTSRYFAGGLDNPAIIFDPGPMITSRMLFNQAIITFSGIQLGHVREFSLDINNNCKEWYGITAGVAARDPIRILSGKIEYKLTLGIDVVDQNDLQLYDFLLNEGSLSQGAPLTGGNIVAVFGAGSDFTFTLYCSVSARAGLPGAVIEKVDFPMNVTEGGYYPMTLYLDVDRVVFV